MQKASRRASEGDEERVAQLQALAQAVAHRPFDAKRMREEAEQLERALGKGALVEAASAAAAMDSATRAVDLSGKQSLSATALTVMDCILSTVRMFASVFGKKA